MKTLPRAAFALVLILGAALAAAQPAQQAAQSRVVRTTTTYSCASTLLGAGCPFLLYTSDCKAQGVKNGHPSVVCTHEVFAEFTLKSGESKTFDSLPPNVKQCQAKNGKLAFPECMF